METLSKKGPASSRSETIGVRLDPKVRYLVELASREEQRSLSSFVERIIRKALTEGFYEETASGHDIAMLPAPKVMWGEGYWDEDQADRLFLLATGRHDLLTLAEQRLWKLLSESILVTGRELDLPTFRAAFHDPMVCTSNLGEEVSA